MVSTEWLRLLQPLPRQTETEKRRKIAPNANVHNHDQINVFATVHHQSANPSERALFELQRSETETIPVYDPRSPHQAQREKESFLTWTPVGANNGIANLCIDSDWLSVHLHTHGVSSGTLMYECACVSLVWSPMGHSIFSPLLLSKCVIE